MMSRNVGPHHNMLFMVNPVILSAPAVDSHPGRRREAGYSLVALLALMTIMALLAAAAAPGIYQQAQREREIEAIYRGEQVAEAIRLYYIFNQQRAGTGDAALPRSMDDLIDGVSRGTKKVQILRPSAARDPLSESGEWRLIRPRSASLSDFQQSLMLYAENVRPVTNDPYLRQIEQLIAPPVIPTLGLTSTQSNTFNDDSFDGPFIGAASSSRNKSVINYYGIEYHNEWVFTPLFR